MNERTSLIVAHIKEHVEAGGSVILIDEQLREHYDDYLAALPEDIIVAVDWDDPTKYQQCTVTLQEIACRLQVIVLTNIIGSVGIDF